MDSMRTHGVWDSWSALSRGKRSTTRGGLALIRDEIVEGFVKIHGTCRKSRREQVTGKRRSIVDESETNRILGRILSGAFLVTR